MLIQQLNERIDRSLQMSGTSDAENLTVPEPEAGKVLAWNSDETALENLTPNSAAYLSVSAFIQTLLDDANAAAARSTLGATGLGANTFTGLQIWAKGADIASAATLVPGTDGNYFDVTGTTGPTTAITVAAGTLFMLQFDSTPTWTHHATDLALPGAANITWAAGDRAICFAEAANQVRVLAATHAGGIIASEIANNAVTLAKLVAATQASVLVGRRSGSAGNFEEVTLGSGLSMSAGGVLSASAGAMVQLVNMTIAEATGTTAIPMDDSLPQSTEGTEIGSQAIVLADNTNKVLIHGALQVGVQSSNDAVIVALFRGTTCISTRIMQISAAPSTHFGASMAFAVLDSPATAGSVTYSVRIGGGTAGQGWAVGVDASGASDFGDTADDGLILMEIAA